MDCNGTIRPAPAELLDRMVDPDILARFDRFWRCANCGKVYWRGSHYQRMLEAVQRINEQRESTEVRP
jgi:uncharacterized protein with PIN domain